MSTNFARFASFARFGFHDNIVNKKLPKVYAFNNIGKKKVQYGSTIYIWFNNILYYFCMDQ